MYILSESNYKHQPIMRNSLLSRKPLKVGGWYWVPWISKGPFGVLAYPQSVLSVSAAPSHPDDLFACLPLCLSTLTRCHAKYWSIMWGLWGNIAIWAVPSKCIHTIHQPSLLQSSILIIFFSLFAGKPKTLGKSFSSFLLPPLWVSI